MVKDFTVLGKRKRLGDDGHELGPPKKRLRLFGSHTLSPLEMQPPEILQKILMHTVEDDLHENRRGVSNLGLKTIHNIGLASKTLRAHAETAGLSTVSSEMKSARADALINYKGFLQAVENRNDILVTTTNYSSPEYRDKLGRLDALVKNNSESVLGFVKYLKEGEQFNLLSTLRDNTRHDHMAKLMLSASEHPEDFHPGPRSEMHENLIRLLPSLTGPDSLEKACKNLAKAFDARYLVDSHSRAMDEMEHTIPGLQSLFNSQVTSLGTTPSDGRQSAAKPVDRPLTLGDSHMENINGARQRIMCRLAERSYSR